MPTLIPLGAAALTVPVVLVLGVALAAGATSTAAAQSPPVSAACGTAPAQAGKAIDGTVLDSTQLADAQLIYDVSASLQLPQQAAVIAIATAMQESSLVNIDHGTSDSLGLFQQRPSQGWGTPAQIMDPVYASTRFYQALEQVPDWQSLPLTVAAQDVQHSSHPGAYAQWEQLAQDLIATFTGTGGDCANELNLLDARVAGASHSFGGWTMARNVAGDAAPACVVFLPAAFAEQVGNGRAVMREILLTLTRQALLARRELLTAERLAADDGPGVGLAVYADPFATTARGPHGLAWGETGEGRNPAVRVLDQVHDFCVGPDAAWADARPDGFTWWPYQQAQQVTATLHGASDVAQGVSVRIATEVRREVPVTPETLRVVAGINAELGQATLALREDGLLFLATRIYVHEGTSHWASRWAQMLVPEQFIMARDLSARLAAVGGFGEEAVSAHPFSGPRPVPDELFGIRDSTLIGWAASVEEGLTPIVALLALGRPYTLPIDLSSSGEDGAGLTFSWRPSQGNADLPVEPVIWVGYRLAMWDPGRDGWSAAWCQSPATWASRQAGATTATWHRLPKATTPSTTRCWLADGELPQPGNAA